MLPRGAVASDFSSGAVGIGGAATSAMNQSGRSTAAITASVEMGSFLGQQQQHWNPLDRQFELQNQQQPLIYHRPQQQKTLIHPHIQETIRHDHNGAVKTSKVLRQSRKSSFEGGGGPSSELQAPSPYKQLLLQEDQNEALVSELARGGSGVDIGGGSGGYGDGGVSLEYSEGDGAGDGMLFGAMPPLSMALRVPKPQRIGVVNGHMQHNNISDSIDGGGGDSAAVQSGAEVVGEGAVMGNGSDARRASKRKKESVVSSTVAAVLASVPSRPLSRATAVTANVSNVSHRESAVGGVGKTRGLSGVDSDLCALQGDESTADIFKDTRLPKQHQQQEQFLHKSSSTANDEENLNRQDKVSESKDGSIVNAPHTNHNYLQSHTKPRGLVEGGKGAKTKGVRTRSHRQTQFPPAFVVRHVSSKREDRFVIASPGGVGVKRRKTVGVSAASVVASVEQKQQQENNLNIMSWQPKPRLAGSNSTDTIAEKNSTSHIVTTENDAAVNDLTALYKNTADRADAASSCTAGDIGSVRTVSPSAVRWSPVSQHSRRHPHRSGRSSAASILRQDDSNSTAAVLEKQIRGKKSEILKYIRMVKANYGPAPFSEIERRMSRSPSPTLLRSRKVSSVTKSPSNHSTAGLSPLRKSPTRPSSPHRQSPAPTAASRRRSSSPSSAKRSSPRRVVNMKRDKDGRLVEAPFVTPLVPHIKRAFPPLELEENPRRKRFRDELDKGWVKSLIVKN